MRLRILFAGTPPGTTNSEVRVEKKQNQKSIWGNASVSDYILVVIRVVVVGDLVIPRAIYVCVCVYIYM